MKTTRGAALLAVTFLMATSACVTSGARRAAEEDIVRVYVDNQNFSDATIFAHFVGSGPIRLGQVVGKTREMLTFRFRDGEVRLEIRLLAGGSHMTQPIPIYRGDELELIVPADLRR